MSETAEAVTRISNDIVTGTLDGLPRVSAVGPFTIPTRRWRVKLYRLQSGVWNDEGTGFCWGVIDDSAREAFLVVEDETSPNVQILHSRVVGAITYQKQDTLIIWNDPDSTVDLALSFQEAAGCVSLCDFLVHVHQYLDPDVSLCVSVNQSDISEKVTDPVTLPPLPTDVNLPDVIKTIGMSAESQYGRDCLVVFFEHHHYLKHMAQLFDDLETKGSTITSDPSKRLNALYQLSRLVKAIFALGEGLLIDHMLENEYFLAILGILEYDPSFGTRKANYREYYKTQTRFKEVVPIPDGLVLEKIRRTFRLQLLKDVVLARSMDDSTFGLVSTLIYVNQMEVVMALQSSGEFSAALFGLFDNSGEPHNSREKAEGLRFIHHVMTTSKQFPAQQRVQLYVHMLETGLVDALIYGLEDAGGDPELQGVTLESLTYVLELDPTVVRSQPERLVTSLLRLLFGREQPRLSRALRIQAFEAIKLLLHNAHAEDSFGDCAREVFNAAAESATGLGSETVLDLLEFCFTADSVETSDLVAEISLWSRLTEALPNDTNQYRPSLLLSLVRCITKALNLPQTELAEYQARLIARSGILTFVLERLVALGNVNTAVHSSLMGILKYIIADNEKQCHFLRTWIARNNGALISELSYVPFLSELAVVDDDTEEDENSRLGSGRKRPVEEEPYQRRTSQRLRLSDPTEFASPDTSFGSPISGPVDEVDQLDPEGVDYDHINRFNTPPPGAGSPRSIGKLNAPPAPSSPQLKRPASAPPHGEDSPSLSNGVNGSRSPNGSSSSSGSSGSSTSNSSNSSPHSKSVGSGNNGRFGLRKTFAQAKKRLLPQRNNKDTSLPSSR